MALAGGRSVRFGSEKALAPLAGRPLLAHVVETLASVCPALAVSARPGGGAAALAASLGLESLPDDPAHPSGPLAGLAAGLAWARRGGFDRLVTLPCDTPLVGKDAILRLLAALGEAPAAYAVTDDGPQPLCAVWRVSLEAELARRLAAGDHPAARAFLAELGAAAVDFGASTSFRNANDPQALLDLARLRAPDQ